MHFKCAGIGSFYCELIQKLSNIFDKSLKLKSKRF